MVKTKKYPLQSANTKSIYLENNILLLYGLVQIFQNFLFYSKTKVLKNSQTPTFGEF